MRSRLFESWYNASERRNEFSVLSANVTDEDGVSNYAAIILRKDNPNYYEITEEFRQAVELLSKPPF